MQITNKKFQFLQTVESSYNTPARSRQSEFLQGKGESIIIGIVDQKSMEDGLLDAFGLVTRRDQWTCCTDDHIAFFNTSRLGVFDAIRFDSIDDRPPLAIDVDGPKRLDITGCTGAKVNLVAQLVQSIHRAGSFRQHIFVQV